MSWQPSQRSSMYMHRAINIDTVCYKMPMERESGSVHVYIYALNVFYHQGILCYETSLTCTRVSFLLAL